MKTLVLAALLAGQEEPLERAFDLLSSDRVDERDRAQADLTGRADRALRAIEEQLRAAAKPEEKERLHAALEAIVGGKVLSLERVKSTRVTARFKERSLREALDDVQASAKIPIRLEGTSGPVPNQAFEGKSLDSALDLLTRQVGAYWLILGESVVVFAAGKVPIRIFDVQGLTMAFRDEPALPLDPSGGPPLPEGEWRQPLTGEDVANLVKNSVDKDRWEEADGKSIQFMNGYLIVRNEPPTLARVEAFLDTLYRKCELSVRVEVEVYLCQAGTEFGERFLAGERPEGPTLKRLAVLERRPRDKRRIALAATAKTSLLTRIDEQGRPVVQQFITGPQMNVRASLGPDRTSVSVELEAGFSKILSVARKKTDRGEIQVPEIANHVLRHAAPVPAGTWTVVGRFQGAQLDPDRTDIVILGRFTPVE